MRWIRFKEWRVGTKLYTVLGLLLCMLLAQGLFGLREAGVIQARLSSLYDDDLMPIQAVDRMESSLTSLREHALQTFLDPNAREHHRQAVEAQAQRLAALEDAYRQNALDGTERSLLDRFHAAWSGYLERIRPHLAEGDETPWQQARTLLTGEAGSLLGQAQAALEELAQWQMRQASERNEAAQAAYQDMRLLIAAIILLALALAAFLGWRLQRAIRRPLGEVSGVLQALDAGDLTHRVHYRSADEFGAMANDLNNALTAQQQLIQHVTQTVEQLATAGEEMSTVTEQTTETVNEQRIETEQVATAMNQMTATVQEVASHISQTAAAAREAHDQTRQGAEVVRQAVAQINALARQIEASAETIAEVEQHSKAISAVLEVIRGVAEQTNLLALNAAIEAARAGEQGRGFAVVADEVRTLAGRTQASTEEINEMIEKLQACSRRAVEMMAQSREQSQQAVAFAAQSGEALEAISEMVGHIDDMSTQIASAAEEQRAVSEEINRNVVRINEMSNQTASGAEETTMASQNLARMATELHELIRRFKV